MLPGDIDLDDVVTSSQVSGWDLALAVLAVLLSWLASRYVSRGVLSVLGRVGGVTENLAHFAARVCKYLVVMLGVGVALTFLGAEIQPFITMAIIVAVVAVLALRGVADNFASGVVLQTRRPVDLGDEIEALGFTGVIVEMNGRSVVVQTYDGRTVHLPNSKVLDNPVVNNSEHRARRTEIEVRARRTGDIGASLDAIGDAARDAHGVLADPAPAVVLTTAEPERIIVRLRVWSQPGEETTVGSAVVRSVADALQGMGVDASVTTPPPRRPDPPSAPL